MILLLISFLAGILTVLAPCVLPLLPVIVGGSVAGKPSFKKALVVTISLGVSVIVFTLILKVSTLFITIPPNFWKWLSAGIIILFGLVTLFPGIWDKLTFINKLSLRSNKVMASGFKKKSFLGDIIVGASLGPVFSSCSPTYFLILATVLPQRPVVGFFYLLAYAVGLSGALLIVAFAGQKIITRLGVASDPYGWFKKTLGVIFLVVGVAILLGFDTKIQTSILNAGFFDVTKIEQSLLRNSSVDENISTSTKQGNPLLDVTSSSSPTESEFVASNFPKSTDTIATARARALLKSKLYPYEQEIARPAGFVNTSGQPITIGEFKGKKVVLLDIWTYSCINCQRTLPYLKTWYEKYHDKGLEIISIHTPEFGFEKVQKNVEDAVKRFGLKYPVVLDNDYATWNAYGNNYWPRKYLIDIDGYIVHDTIGEGGYAETEVAIQKALEERNQVLGTKDAISKDIANPADAITADTKAVASPEIYFGSQRNLNLGNGQKNKQGEQTLTLPEAYQSNILYLGGTWNFSPEFAENITANAKIVFKYSAKNVYMVASSEKGVTIKILKDGVVVGTQYVKENRLYDIIKGDSYGDHTLEIQVEGAGLNAYTFTFG